MNQLFDKKLEAGEVMNNKRNLLILLLLFVFSISTFGFTEEKYKQIEDNLLVGLNTDNRGLQVSCAYFLGEMKSERAINPLLKMLKSGETEEERIIAALSLSKIQTEQCMFAVKQRIKFDDSERVQDLCEKFYNCYMVSKLKSDVIVESIKTVQLDIEYNGVKLADFAR